MPAAAAAKMPSHRAILLPSPVLESVLAFDAFVTDVLSLSVFPAGVVPLVSVVSSCAGSFSTENSLALLAALAAAWIENIYDLLFCRFIL